MRIGRHQAREILRLTDSVASGASLVMGGSSLASDIARERLVAMAYGKPERPAPTVTFPEDGD